MTDTEKARCANCDGEIIRADVTMQGPRGPWIHEATRTRMCQDGFTTPRFAEPCECGHRPDHHSGLYGCTAGSAERPCMCGY